jgi:hypothetical protein
MPHEADEWERFLQLWREQKYFECHEVLESLWLVATGDAKWRYQGLIHCAVALYQYQRQNWFGMARQWLRAGAKLSCLPQEEVDADCRRIWLQTCRTVEAAAAKLTDAERARLRRLRCQLENQHPRNNEKIMPLQDVLL